MPAAASNPFAKLFGGLGRTQAGAPAGNTLATPSGPNNPLAGFMSQSLALPHGGPKPPQRNAQ